MAWCSMPRPRWSSRRLHFTNVHCSCSARWGGIPAHLPPKSFSLREKLLAEGTPSDRQPLAVLEINTPSLGGPAASDNMELLGLIEQLAPIAAVMVTNYPEATRCSTTFAATPPRPSGW